MGYTTSFRGEFKLDRKLSPEHAAYLTAFSRTRRMSRDADKAALLPDPVRLAAGLPIGPGGSYFVGGNGFFGQGNDESVIDHNLEPGASRGVNFEHYREERAQPGLWCQWVPNEDGTAIVWDDGEKFYDYIPWIEYLIKHFLSPWGYVLNGTMTWQGESHGDVGTITIAGNAVSATENKRR